MLGLFRKKLLCSSGKPSVVPEICNLSLVSLLCSHLSRGIANKTDANNKDHMTVSYLINSCGLSTKSALSVCKHFRLKSIENSDSVLKLLKAYCGSDGRITTIITKYPKLLKTHADGILKPKLEFFCSVGLHGDDIADILATNPSLMSNSLNRIVECVNFFSATLSTKSDVIQALKCTRRCVDSSCQAQYKILQDHGMADNVIVFLLKFYPASLLHRELLVDAVRTVKEMGFPPTCHNFARAVCVITNISKNGWLRKLKLLRELGWSDEEIFTMFWLMPTTLGLSEESIRAKVKFFDDKLGWGPAILSKLPSLITMSLEKRTVPRFLVLNQLMSMGLIPLKWRKTSFLVSNQNFSKKYIDGYKDKAPVIVELYQGNTNMQEQNIPLKWRKSSFVVSNQNFSKKYIDGYKDKAPIIVEL